MPTGLLITRPRAEATRLAERLNSLGIRSWVYPTIDITPLTPTAESLSWAAQAALWIFVSANAVHAGWGFLAPLHQGNPPSSPQGNPPFGCSRSGHCPAPAGSQRNFCALPGARLR
ncbi:hypothetical protein CARN8_680003 [mine drainage metagenome]|uniref:Uroporphyrinogen-III synthase n=1 Tax=mine drainage metagenome TaxID=410659 RepID=A0A3P3ZRL5_9ZZZZ